MPTVCVCCWSRPSENGKVKGMMLAPELTEDRLITYNVYMIRTLSTMYI